MPPIRGQKEREWTTFELQTLLALMAKGVHLEGQSTKKDDASAARRNAHLNFATELNKALHGEDYRQDIPRREVTRMLEKMLAERKHVVGRGGLIERQTMNRLTRSLKLAWESNRKMDFDGSIAEWKGGRKLNEINKERAAQGLPPLLEIDFKEKEAEEEEIWAASTVQQKLLQEEATAIGETSLQSPSAVTGMQGIATKNTLSMELAVRVSHLGDGPNQSSTSDGFDGSYSPFSAHDYIHTGKPLQFSVSQERSTAGDTRDSNGTDYNGYGPSNDLRSRRNGGLTESFNASQAGGGTPKTQTMANSGNIGAKGVDTNAEANSDADCDFEWDDGEIH